MDLNMPDHASVPDVEAETFTDTEQILTDNTANTQAARKAVILAAGRGTRMREQRSDVILEREQAMMADLGLKGMIPFANRPFLDYVLSGLADAGFSEACLVVNPQQQLFRDHYTRLAPPTRIGIAFAVQEKPLGTADALARAKGFTADEPFVMINSDNYYPVPSLAALRTLGEPGLIGFDRQHLPEGSNITADRLAKYAICFVDSDAYLERIIEKPEPDMVASSARNVVISMNCWRFSPTIFDACHAIAPSARQELELADAVQYAIDVMHERFRVLRTDASVLGLTDRSDIPNIAGRLQGMAVQT